MPEVYTKENKAYYKNLGQFKCGDQHISAKLTDQ